MLIDLLLLLRAQGGESLDNVSQWTHVVGLVGRLPTQPANASMRQLHGVKATNTFVMANTLVAPTMDFHTSVTGQEARCSE